ncbi:MAG: EF-P 5-aminopentanol modification-associated protein YfmH [Planctomycetota bacterium]
MKLSEQPNVLGEPVLAGVASSGLRVLVNPRPGWARSFAALGVNFGSIDRVAGADGRPVPEGLAHFLEHKLFEDAVGDVSDRFAALGASTNAMTSFVGTTYVASTVDNAGECLDLLLDFVQDPWFTEALVAKEQGIIAQEIRMYDDDPEWRVFFGLLGCLYARHPAKDNIAGTVASIAAIDAPVLRRCYDLFYHPANLCLTVAGSLSPEDVARRVEADQAGRPPDGRGPHLRSTVDEPPDVASSRCELRLAVARPRLLFGIKERELGGGGPAIARREITTRILLDLLFGRSSAAYERLYAAGIIDETFSVWHGAEESFAFSTIGGDTDDPALLEAALREEFERARREGLDAAAFRRVRNRTLGSLLRSLDSPESVAWSLLSESFRGVAPLQELALLDAVSLADVQQRLEEHVRPQALAVAVVRPNDEP